jgi:CRP-like cAMP-binding protein
MLTPEQEAEVPSPSPKKSVRKRSPEIRARPFDRASDRPSEIENLLSLREQEGLRSIATVLDYARGGITIFSESEDAHFVFAVDEGIVRLGRHSENGQRQILAFMLPGDLIGLPDGGIYVNTAETVSAARIYRFPWQQLRQIMMREPQLQLNLLIKVAYDLRQAQHRIMMLGQKNTYQRLASFLLDLQRHSEFFDAEQSLLNLPINRFDLADYLGTAPETTARAFMRLEETGLIRRISSRSIKIRDIAGLQQLLLGRRRRNNPPAQNKAT